MEGCRAAITEQQVLLVCFGLQRKKRVGGACRVKQGLQPTRGRGRGVGKMRGGVLGGGREGGRGEEERGVKWVQGGGGGRGRGTERGGRGEEGYWGGGGKP